MVAAYSRSLAKWLKVRVRVRARFRVRALGLGPGNAINLFFFLWSFKI